MQHIWGTYLPFLLIPLHFFLQPCIGGSRGPCKFQKCVSSSAKSWTQTFQSRRRLDRIGNTWPKYTVQKWNSFYWQLTSINHCNWRLQFASCHNNQLITLAFLSPQFLLPLVQNDIRFSSIWVLKRLHHQPQYVLKKTLILWPYLDILACARVLEHGNSVHHVKRHVANLQSVGCRLVWATSNDEIGIAC